MAKPRRKRPKITMATSPNRKSVTCSFCNGKGTDPFGIPSKMSSCQVCKGTGNVFVEAPTMTCAFCGGSGVHFDKQLTCSVCNGKGVVTKPKDSKTCPDCLGSGVAQDGLPDLLCRGTGVI